MDYILDFMLSVDQYEKIANKIFISGDAKPTNKTDLNIKTMKNQGFLPKKYLFNHPATISDNKFEKIQQELNECLENIVEKYFIVKNDKYKFCSEEIEKKIIEANISKTMCPALLSEAKMECVNYLQKNYLRKFLLATHEMVLSRGTNTS